MIHSGWKIPFTLFLIVAFNFIKIFEGTDLTYFYLAVGLLQEIGEIEKLDLKFAIIYFISLSNTHQNVWFHFLWTVKLHAAGI